ncbi:MAG TPA: hypothetical protein PLG47_05910 [Candidatus Dojkabacteria bacterium]|nr:hypothetical protein [Candidatus Dojkabacteria bacterium]
MKTIFDKIIAWFKTNWKTVFDFMTIIFAYNFIYGKEGVLAAEVLLGFWLFVSISHAIIKTTNKKK